MRTLMWFRSDLRLDDNTALYHAAKAADDGVVALFVVSVKEWREHDYSPGRISLLRRTLRELSESLDTLRIPLRLIEAEKPGDVPRNVVEFAVEQRCDEIHFNREYEVNEHERDETTLQLATERGVRAYAHEDQAIVPPGSVRTGSDTYYTVFTPYKRSLIKRLKERGVPELLPAPGKQADMGLRPSQIAAKFGDYEPGVHEDRWPAGEKAARKRLEEFVEGRIRDYADARDIPAVDGTSGVSAYLALGMLSPRRCLRAAAEASSKSAEAALTDGGKGVTTWISELFWRDFYINIVKGFPRVSMHRPFQLKTEKVRWKDNDEHFEAWCEGRTGVPIVDAGMRQLREEGWMHNRVRMITAMYLTKNLFIDWRKGEKFFMQNLVDGHLPSNNGGWQWSASTGTDAAPYFRVFNPVSQSEKFDKKGEYIRRYVPELKEFADSAIHAPWEAGEKAIARVDYAEPLVDLSETRKHAIEAFKKLSD